MSRRLFVSLVVMMLLGGCASSQWKSSKSHLKIAIAPLVNPIASQSQYGVTAFGNKIVPVDMGFDINGEIGSVLRENLGRFERFTLVDLPVDPKALSIAMNTKDRRWGIGAVPKLLANQLVQAANGRDIDYIIAVIDSRGPGSAAGEWGLYQHHTLASCVDPYVSYVVYVFDPNSGETVAFEAHTGFKRIEDGIAWDEAWSAIPDAKRQEVLEDLKAVVRDDMPRTLTRMGVIPNSSFAKYPDPYVCTPPM